jgi:hypothetical protein
MAIGAIWDLKFYDRAVEMLPLEIRSVLGEAKLALKLPLEPLTFPSYPGRNDRCKNRRCGMSY